METNIQKTDNRVPLVKPKRIRIVGKEKNWVEIDYEQFRTLIHINYLAAILRNLEEKKAA